MIKTIFFDIDGTLVSHTQNEVPESTRTSLEQLAEKGIQRVVATGRHILELPLLPVNNIRFDAHITLNGQLCLDAQGNILFGSPITGKCRDCIIRMFNEKTIPIMIVEKERMYINSVDQHVETVQEAISTPVPVVGAYTGNEIYQAWESPYRWIAGKGFLLSLCLPGRGSPDPPDNDWPDSTC